MFPGGGAADALLEAEDGGATPATEDILHRDNPLTQGDDLRTDPPQQPRHPLSAGDMEGPADTG